MKLDLFPIRILSERTGVPSSTIRAWERRYGILEAQRTLSGHRHYNEQDVLYVKNLVQCMEQGYTISKAIRELSALKNKGETFKQQVQLTLDEQFHHLIEELLQAISIFDQPKLDVIYQQSLALYPVDVVTEKILRPVLVHLGQRWREDKLGVAKEHFFATYLRNKIGARLHHDIIGDGPLLIVACLPGEFHELGSLLFALFAKSQAYKVITMGADLPLDQVPDIVDTTSASAVILASSSLHIDANLADQLSDLAKKVSVPIMLGGTTSKGVSIDRVVSLGDNLTEALQQVDECLLSWHKALPAD
ncbi:MAG: MerR family transcriptional regulator [Gammaproteobacteria bacterium]|jgi:DNA-binding transcriptional MerR regulator|nr:MerR family transcriptional regulator [Gammaproteobacteria bacterium]